MRLAFYVVITWVYYTPILGASGISKTVDPGFLKGQDVPVIGVGCVKHIGLSCLRLVYILLPNS